MSSHFREDKDPGSVKSLLALLRPQSSPSSAAPPQPAPPVRRPQPPPQPPWLQAMQASEAAPLPVPLPATASIPSSTMRNVPDQGELKGLLARLQKQNEEAVIAGPSSSRSAGGRDVAASGAAPPSSFAARPNDRDQKEVNLDIDGYDPSRPGNVTYPGSIVDSATNRQSQQQSRSTAKNATADRSELRNMPLSRAMIALGVLLETGTFVQELKKMKAEQDALEKQLWEKRAGKLREYKKQKDEAAMIAKSLGHGGSSEADELARRSRLNKSLSSFYKHECLPFFDALRNKQIQKLENLGVPGLGAYNFEQDPTISKEEKEKVSERRRKIMELLEGVMAEG